MPSLPAGKLSACPGTAVTAPFAQVPKAAPRGGGRRGGGEEARRAPACRGRPYLHVAVEAEGGHEDAVHVAEGRGALLLPVDEERQRVLIQVQQHADGGPLAHAAFRPGERSPEEPLSTPGLGGR